jgi:hypothetical protein
MVHSRVFYPNVSVLADAARIRVNDEEEVENIDITVVDVRAFCVTAQRKLTQHTSNSRITIGIGTSGTPWLVGTGALIADVNVFHFCGLEPGDYVLNESVSLMNQSSASFGMESLSIDKSNVVLEEPPLSPAQKLTGQLKVEDGQLVTQMPQAAKIWLDPVDRLPFADEDVFGVSAIDGQVSFNRLFPGKYSVRVDGLSSGYYVSEISADGKDGLRQPIESQSKDFRVVVRSDGPSVTGSVSCEQPEDGAAFTTVTVVLIGGDDTGVEIFRSQRTDQGGSFQFVSGLPPGKYKIIALTGLGPDDDKDTQIMRKFMTEATELNLKPAESQTIRLKPVKALL